MNSISSLQKGDPGLVQISGEVIQESIYPYQFELNITDGGEFLDDSLRMNEQPLGETNTKEKE